MGNKTGTFGFTKGTKALEALEGKDLKGKHYFITGANTGIGYETARALFLRGGSVTLACRNEEKMKAAEKQILEEKNENSGELFTIKVDLSVTESIIECVKEFESRNTKIDVLIDNAGLAIMKNTRSKEGHTYMMAVNHFGTHVITMLLLPLIKEDGRIVVLSSLGHKAGKIDLDDLSMKYLGDEVELSVYKGMMVYCTTKLCNLLFARELNKRLKEAGKKITAYSVHPGGVDSEFNRYSKEKHKFLFNVFHPLMKVMQKDCEQGAATSVFCAVDERVLEHSGAYFADCDLGSMTETAKDDELAKKLFDKTVEISGYDIPGIGEGKVEATEEKKEVEIEEKEEEKEEEGEVEKEEEEKEATEEKKETEEEKVEEKTEEEKVEAEEPEAEAAEAGGEGEE